MPNNRIAPMSDGEKMPSRTEIVTYIVKTDNDMMGFYELGAIDEEVARIEFNKIVQKQPRPKEWPWKLHKVTFIRSDEVIA